MGWVGGKGGGSIFNFSPKIAKLHIYFIANSISAEVATIFRKYICNYESLGFWLGAFPFSCNQMHVTEVNCYLHVFIGYFYRKFIKTFFATYGLIFILLGMHLRRFL